MQYRINLKAGVPTRQELQGRTFVIVDTGAATEIDLKIEIQGFASEELRAVRRGFKLRAPGFTSCLVQAAVDCTLEIVTSWADISINYQDGNSVNATIVGVPKVSIDGQPVKVDTEGRVVKVQQDTPLAVLLDRGAPANPVYVSGLTYSDAPATSIVDRAAVAVTDVGAVILAADTSRKAARFANTGTDPVALGTTGITWGKRCIVLNPGDVWVEEKAANLAWAAICDATKTASVTAQEVLA